MIDDEFQARSWVHSLPSCDDRAVARLESLIELLTAENLRQNLVAAATMSQVWRRHIADSAQLVGYVPRETRSWLDLGSGAGFPGAVVAILAPETMVTLAESRSRRAEWLLHVVAELALDNAEVWPERIEVAPARSFDSISARAFAPLERLLTSAARFSTSATTWLLPKGRSAADELRGLRGWRHAFHVEQSSSDPAAGIIVGHLLGREGS